jgi:hypothetical protein
VEIKKPYAVVQYSKFLKGVHIRSEVKLDKFVNSAFRYTNGLALRSSIQTICMQFLKSPARKYKLQCQTVSKKIYRVEH